MFIDVGTDIPNGWVKGRASAGPNNGRKWVNDGVNNVFLKPGEDIPDGFFPGRI
jgi:hypothetical protein